MPDSSSVKLSSNGHAIPVMHSLSGKDPVGRGSESRSNCWLICPGGGFLSSQQPVTTISLVGVNLNIIHGSFPGSLQSASGKGEGYGIVVPAKAPFTEKKNIPISAKLTTIKHKGWKNCLNFILPYLLLY